MNKYLNPGKVLSIIIPLFNEEGGIENLVTGLNSQYGKHSIDTEFIFVDDGSIDKTVQELREKLIGLKFPSKIVKLSKNFGSHAALRAGISCAAGRYITFLPADLQDPPSLPFLLYTELSKGFDIVWAQRATVKSGWTERTVSNIYARLMRKFVSPSYPLLGFDIVMFNEKVKNLLLKNEESNSSIYLQILSFGFSQSFISYDKAERKIGASKWTFSKKIKLLIDSFAAFSYFPIRLVTVSGFSMFFGGLLLIIYIIIRKIIFEDLIQGWPALISILLLGFGITNISLGIIAEYLWRTLDASRRRPVFIVDEIMEINQ